VAVRGLSSLPALPVAMNREPVVRARRGGRGGPAGGCRVLPSGAGFATVDHASQSTRGAGGKVADPPWRGNGGSACPLRLVCLIPGAQRSGA
jgi:hypothetical protein